MIIFQRHYLLTETVKLHTNMKAYHAVSCHFATRPKAQRNFGTHRLHWLVGPPDRAVLPGSPSPLPPVSSRAGSCIFSLPSAGAIPKSKPPSSSRSHRRCRPTSLRPATSPANLPPPRPAQPPAPSPVVGEVRAVPEKRPTSRRATSTAPLHRVVLLPAADASDMLPGPLLLPPPPPPELVGYPSLSPSPTPSSSIGSSIAIVLLVILTTIILTCLIVVIRRSYRRHRRLSCSSISPRCSLSPRASSSSSSTMSQMWCAAVAAVGASQRASNAKSLPEMVMMSSDLKDAGKAPPVANSAEGSVEGTMGSVASSVASASAMAPSGVERLVPSAPPLPEVERVLLELLSLQPVPMKTGSSTVCFICKQVFLPADVLLILPVCSHMFHQSCFVTWLRTVIPPRCPLCHASITVFSPDKNRLDQTFCSDDYDVEAQTLVPVPAPPGEDVAEAGGGSRGWLRSSIDRLSGSWRCSSSRATAAVVPVSSRRTTGSWSLGSSGDLCIDSHGIQTHEQLPVPTAEEVAEAAGDSRGWLRSSLTTLSGSWGGCSNSRPTAMVLPESSRRKTGSVSLGSSGDRSIDSSSRRWDPEMADQPELRERPWVFDYARWLFRNSG